MYPNVGNTNPSEGDFVANASNVISFIFEWLEVIAQTIIFVVFVFTFVCRLMTVKGNSMLNTLHNADKVFAWRYNYVPTNGDVVVIRKYGQLTESIVKRVIATQGQQFHIDFASGSVYVNGKKLDEYYIKEPMTTYGDQVIPSVIPQGKCFVMGDNRNGSTDSRWSLVGLVDYKDVVGKVCYIYFPFYRMGTVARAVQ